MQIHSNASTCHKQRLLIQKSPLSCRQLAAQLGISVATVHRWTSRATPEDPSTRTTARGSALGESECKLIFFLREARLSLDDIVDQVSLLIPDVVRSGVHRVLRRNGLNRRPK